MATKFSGGLDELKWRLKEHEQYGEWVQIGDLQQYRAANGGILNYWPSTSSVNFQGQSPGKDELKAIVEGNANEAPVGHKQSVTDSKE